MKKIYEKPLIEILDMGNQDVIMFSLTDEVDVDVHWDVFDIFSE